MKPTERSEPALARWVRLALVFLFVWMIKGLLLPIALGGLFALLLTPVSKRLAAKLGKRGGWSPMILTVSAIVLVVLPSVLLATRVVSSINHFLDRDWGQVSLQVQEFIQDKLGWLHLGEGRFTASAETLVRQVGAGVASVAGNLAKALPGTIVDLFLFLLALYYFLRDGPALIRRLETLSPFPPEPTQELFTSIRETVNGAILGLCATAAVQGGLATIALFVFRVPGALLFGILAALFSFIPMVGTTPVTLGAVIYLLAAGRPGAAAGMAVAAVVIGFSDNIVRPMVQSAHSTTMHPLVVLLGIFGGLELFGATGVFVGPVVAAMAIWAIDTYTRLQRKVTAPPPSAS